MILFQVSWKGKKEKCKESNKLGFSESRLRYQKEFGFTIPERKIIVDDIRIRAVGKSGVDSGEKLEVSKGHPLPSTVSMNGIILNERSLLTCYISVGKTGIF